MGTDYWMDGATWNKAPLRYFLLNLSLSKQLSGVGSITLPFFINTQSLKQFRDPEKDTDPLNLHWRQQFHEQSHECFDVKFWLLTVWDLICWGFYLIDIFTGCLYVCAWHGWALVCQKLADLPLTSLYASLFFAYESNIKLLIFTKEITVTIFASLIKINIYRHSRKLLGYVLIANHFSTLIVFVVILKTF